MRQCTTVLFVVITEAIAQTDRPVGHHTLRQFTSSPLIILLCRPCISNVMRAYSSVRCSLHRPFHSKQTSVVKQLACIWPYSFSPLRALIWTPALFFFLLLFCCHTRRLFWDERMRRRTLWPSRWRSWQR